MTRILEFVGKIWPLLATLGLLGSIVWYFALLDGRVRDLEQRVHTLTVAPVIVAAGDNSASVTDNSQAPTVANPVARACADLALQAAGEAVKKNDAATRSIRSLMQDLGCM